jgi:N utilization substance protein B
VIRSHLIHWDFDRVNKVDLSILRLSVYTLLFQHDVHPTIVIDEAVDIAKQFSLDESYKFINAVLDNVRKAAVTESP